MRQPPQALRPLCCYRFAYLSIVGFVLSLSSQVDDSPEGEPDGKAHHQPGTRSS